MQTKVTLENIQDSLKHEFRIQKEISPDTRFEELDLDSLDLLELVIGLESKFKLDEIDDQDIQNAKTVQDLLTAVNRG